MAGEIWRSTTQVAVETTPGTPVTTSTRRLYLQEPVFEPNREGRLHKFATGTRDNTRAHTLGPQAVSGKASLPMSADEIVELLLLGVKGAVTPTTVDTTARLWTFVPGSTALDAASIKWDDGANVWIAAGCHVDQLTFKGAANEEHMIEAEFFARSLAAGTLTGALAERVPRFHEGWETQMFIEAFAGTPGTTVKAGVLVNWEVSIKNNLSRKYYADNSNVAGGVTIGELEVEAKLTLEASDSDALAEFNNWAAGTKRLVRLQFGNNELAGAATAKYLVSIDLPIAWTAIKLGEVDENTRVYELTGSYVYDPTNLFGVQIRAQNQRATAWAA